MEETFIVLCTVSHAWKCFKVDIIVCCKILYPASDSVVYFASEVKLLLLLHFVFIRFTEIKALNRIRCCSVMTCSSSSSSSSSVLHDPSSLIVYTI